MAHTALGFKFSDLMFTKEKQKDIAHQYRNGHGEHKGQEHHERDQAIEQRDDKQRGGEGCCCIDTRLNPRITSDIHKDQDTKVDQ